MIRKKGFLTVGLTFMLIVLGAFPSFAEPGFDYEAYLAANPDLPAGWGKTEALNHYIHYGFSEGRATAFNLERYLAANPDLPADWNQEEALNHYNQFGKFENRLIAFDEAEYISLYSDLPFDWSFSQALDHYLNYGQWEGRIASFDEVAYLEMYPDLPSGWNQAQAFFHYQRYGSNEGRVFDAYDELIFGPATIMLPLSVDGDVDMRVTVDATGCGEGVYVYSRIFEFQQDGNDLVFNGYDFDGDPFTLYGTLSGDTLSVSGSYREDNGTTRMEATLTVSGNLISGWGTWTWSNKYGVYCKGTDQFDGILIDYDE